MGRKKSIVINADNIGDALNKITELKPFEITSASIKEALCNYGYEIKTGPCAGDKIPTRKGSAFIHSDMEDAFQELNVHLAIIDDAFKFSGKELTTPDLLRDDEITSLFTVTGFKVSGNDENEGYVLIGEKWVTQGSIGLETPKISKSSSYVFFEELKEALENARQEVELYMNGKAAPKMEQTEIDFPTGDDTDFNQPME